MKHHRPSLFDLWHGCVLAIVVIWWAAISSL